MKRFRASKAPCFWIFLRLLSLNLNVDQRLAPVGMGSGASASGRYASSGDEESVDEYPCALPDPKRL